jgi:hypothetical protein
MMQPIQTQLLLLLLLLLHSQPMVRLPEQLVKTATPQQQQKEQQQGKGQMVKAGVWRRMGSGCTGQSCITPPLRIRQRRWQGEVTGVSAECRLGGMGIEYVRQAHSSKPSIRN